MHRLLLIILGFTAFTAIVCGIMLWVHPDGSLMQMPVSWLDRTPFASYLVPGMVLCLVVGGSSLFAFVSSLLKKKYAYKSILLAGVMLGGWIMVQYLLIRMYHPLQVVYLVLAVAMLALARFQKNI
jgi:hypothetical protein